MEIDKEAIGMRIYEIRKEKGLTLEEFGKLVDHAGKSTVSKWERGLTLPNNKRLKCIASLGDVSVFRLLYGSGAGYIFNNYDKILSDKYSIIKDSISMHAISYLGDVIEDKIFNPNDFEGIRRVIDQEYPKIKNDLIRYIDTILTKIWKNKKHKKNVIEKLENESNIFDKHEIGVASKIFDNATTLTFEEKVKYLNHIEAIDSNLEIVAYGKAFYTDTHAYVVNEKHLINNKKTLNLNDDDHIYREYIYYKRFNRPFPLKSEHHEILIRISDDNKCDLISRGSDLLVYYFPEFKHSFLNKYLINSKIVIIRNNELLLGELGRGCVFTTVINNEKINIDLKESTKDTYFFPLQAIYF